MRTVVNPPPLGASPAAAALGRAAATRLESGSHPEISASLPSPAPPPGWWRGLFRVPLLTKLVLADLVINVLAYYVMRSAPVRYAQEIMIAALLVTLTLNAVMVYFALLPLKALEGTASRVSHGDLDARVPLSRLADRNMTRISATLNALLDGVTADRVRMRALAAQVISAGDLERAHIARELHDSTAQSLSALEMLVSASLREVTEGALHERLGVMREIVVEALSEVRTLSHNVHPRVLDDLGLVSALEFLARRTREQSGVATRVASDVRAAVPPAVASVLYRVAQEALRNAVRHGVPSDLRVAVSADDETAVLEVRDDGAGFDIAAVTAERRGMGLFVMRERLALIDGRLEIESRPGAGTRVRAVAPNVAPPAEPSRDDGAGGVAARRPPRLTPAERA